MHRVNPTKRGYSASTAFRNAVMLMSLVIAFLTPSFAAAQEPPLRGMYAFGTIIGQSGPERDLFQFIERNDITYIAFYIRPAEVRAMGQELSDFIITAKRDFGVKQIGATTGGNSAGVIDHNAQFPGKFDVLNLELEFWGGNRDEAHRAERFAQFIGSLQTMRELTTGTNMIVEAYIGGPTPNEMAQINKNLDRLLVHTYVRDPNQAFKVGRSRFQVLSDLKTDIEVMEIFALGPRFTGEWFLNDDNSPNRADFDFRETFELLESIFDDDYASWVNENPNNSLNHVGAHYFIYEGLMNTAPTAKIESPRNSHVVVEGGLTMPIEFTMSATDPVHDMLDFVEWYYQGFQGVDRFTNGKTTSSRTVTLKPPYTVVAVPADKGLYGNPGYYANKGARWYVHASNEPPTGTRVSPAASNIEVALGSSITFVLNVSDRDGNLFAADWSRNGYIGRNFLSQEKTAEVSRTIEFTTLGDFSINVNLIDRAFYLPDLVEKNTNRNLQDVWKIKVVDTNTLPDTSIVSPYQHLVVDNGSSAAPIEFVMKATDKETGLAGVEWYQSSVGYLGVSRFPNGNTSSKSISAVPPYKVTAVAFDHGLNGGPNGYGTAVSWSVHASNAPPTGTRVSPAGRNIEVALGSSMTFVLKVSDRDGNLFAADWYGSGKGFLGRNFISGETAEISRTFEFTTLGDFSFDVDMFDRAVYLPDMAAKQSLTKMRQVWKIKVVDTNTLPDTSIVSPYQHLVVDNGSSAPIEFVMKATDKETGLAGVEWYQSSVGYLGVSRFPNGNTSSKSISAVPPYKVTAVAFDHGLNGGPNGYGAAVSWSVHASNAPPTGTRVNPARRDVEVALGSSVTFVLKVSDRDGNLFAADWYGSGKGFLGRNSISGETAEISGTIEFTTLGDFSFDVDMFDRAVYLPDMAAKQSLTKMRQVWKITVVP